MRLKRKERDQVGKKKGSEKLREEEEILESERGERQRERQREKGNGITQKVGELKHFMISLDSITKSSHFKVIFYISRCYFKTSNSLSLYTNATFVGVDEVSYDNNRCFLQYEVYYKGDDSGLFSTVSGITSVFQCQAAIFLSIREAEVGQGLLSENHFRDGKNENARRRRKTR